LAEAWDSSLRLGGGFSVRYFLIRDDSSANLENLAELLPFFTRLELENGRWVPRTWPPNCGTRRDIPLHANIHHSVEQMFRAGVLSLNQMPKLGGEEGPRILLPLTTTRAWARQREARRRAAAEAQPEEKKATKVGKNKPSDAKSWDTLGFQEAKTWNQD
jgi:hypothetical protein